MREKVGKSGVLEAKESPCVKGEKVSSCVQGCQWVSRMRQRLNFELHNVEIFDFSGGFKSECDEGRNRKQ